MLTQIDHLGIAVHSIDACMAYYETTLGLECLGRESVPSQQVNTAFFKLGEVRLELLEPSDEGSPIAKYLERHGEGIHHIAYRTDAIEEQLAQAATNGVRLIHEIPFVGAANKRVAFLHPKSTHGVLTEFCMDAE
ncbi:MAG: methylmalonyl-CoA epimerase [Opitutales bacterium]|jgi:methylmalonyl-CoA epimerase